MEINIIAAVAKNRAIGYNNDMVYFIKEDLRRFKQLTTGHTVIMGRRTFHSLPKGALPNRRNIVLSRTETNFPGCDVYTSLSEALKHIADNEKSFHHRRRKFVQRSTGCSRPTLSYRNRRHTSPCRCLLSRI